VGKAGKEEWTWDVRGGMLKCTMRGGTEEWGRWGKGVGNEGGRLGRGEGERDLRDTPGALCLCFHGLPGFIKNTKDELEQSSLAPLQQQK
jgi:hypothetical protein